MDSFEKETKIQKMIFLSLTIIKKMSLQALLKSFKKNEFVGKFTNQG